MKDIYYVTSKGERINLIGSPYKMLTETNLFDYKWEAVAQGTNFPRIVKMKKDMVEANVSIRVLGNSKADLLDKVEALTTAFDADVYANEMGRLYVGNYYRRCFILSASHQKVWQRPSTTVQFTIISDDADWVEWEHFEYSGAGSDYEGAVSDTAVITASNNQSSLVVENNSDHTIQIKWTNATANGYIRFDLGEVLQVNSINNLIFKKSIGLAYAIIDISISQDGTNWTSIDTVQQPTRAQDDLRWDYNTVETFRYLRIKHSSSAPPFLIESDSLGIYAQIEPTANELLTQGTVELEDIRLLNWADSLVQFKMLGSQGTIYRDGIEEITNIKLKSMQTDNYIEVQYRQDGVWHALIGHENDVEWSGHQSCDAVRIILSNENSEYMYFTRGNFSVEGIPHRTIVNNSYAPSDAIIRIYGQTSTPRLIIGSNEYGAECDVLEDEYLEIDTKNGTVRLYDIDAGTYVNKFANRVPSTFNPIDVGESEMTWHGDFEQLDIELEKGRSQPKWN